MRLPKRSASTSSRRCMVLARSAPDAGRMSSAAHAQKTMPQPRAAAPRSFLMAAGEPGVLARSRAAQVVRRVVAGRALDRLVDALLFVPQAHGDVAPGLQVVVDLERAEEHRHVVPVLVVEFRRAPQVAAAVVLVDEEDRPAVLVDVERAACVGVAGACLWR